MTTLAQGIGAHSSLSVLQLHHARMRSPAELIGSTPRCPSANEEFGARELTTEEVEQVVEDFIASAQRAERAGFDGVELHGAHGYLLCQFFSSVINQRTDHYGGSLENRARILFDIIDGIRARCRPGFLLGVRLSPERFDVKLAEIRDIARRLMQEARIDFIDLSLWDSFKEPVEEEFAGKSLLSCFTELERGDVRLGAAGKVRSAADVRRCMAAGADFVLLGRAAILHHDFPARLGEDPAFEPVRNPVTADYLRSQGLGDTFVKYMSSWKGFVEG